ncbi:MAG TPA: ABC transporter ATP-binding protein [Chloroflexota bacterium]|nr:ABC transporter ATP-binding protein [Chloroflexota bacterium]
MERQPTDAVVTVEGVRIVYRDPNGRPFVAIDEASFTVRPGEKFVIIGPSGCGKTTLLKAIAGFLAPAAGRIVVAGREVHEPGPDRAVVFQDFDQLFPWRTVLGNLVYALRAAKGVPRATAEQRAHHFLKLVGIDAAAHKYPHMLSGGMKQRAAIARALALEPAILLLDEPFGALDAITRSQLQRELNEIWRRTQVTIILVTHSIQEAVYLGHRVLVLTPAPAVIREIVDTAAAEDVESSAFVALSHHLRELLVTPGQAERAAVGAGHATE